MGEFRKRRQILIESLKNRFDFNNSSLVLFFSSYETGSHSFKQDSTFYYYSGCSAPGSVLTIDSAGFTTLYIPNMPDDAVRWSSEVVQKSHEWVSKLGVDSIEYSGEPIKSHTVSLMWQPHCMVNVINLVNAVVGEGGRIFSLASEFGNHNLYARVAFFRFQLFCTLLPNEHFVDISYVVGEQRRIKSDFELNLLARAVAITRDAQNVAASAIADGVIELHVRAALESEIIKQGALVAFESIVASGDKSTVLHHRPSLKKMYNHDLVVVDIGAQVDGYCADISRTYVVGDSFTPRQQYLYDIVYACQQYLISQAKPGLYIRNSKLPDQSLHHMALQFFENYDLASCFPHSIGHYLGLDVHDVGDYQEPLKVGDVVTLEPGIYIPSEAIGIRIEDDFYISSSGVVSLAEM